MCYRWVSLIFNDKYYSIDARYSVAVITGIFDASKSFPLRVIMTSTLALRAV